MSPNVRLRPLKPGLRTANKCLTLLVGIFRYAVENGFMNRNAAEGMDKIPAAEGEGGVIDQNVLTPAELRKLIDAVEPWAAPIMLSAYTGARQAEVLGLQCGDVDWNRRTAEIRRQWRRRAFCEPKTKASRGTVELPDELVSALKRWRLRCPKGEHDLNCPNARGLPMQSSDHLRTAGIRQVRFHNLRHSFASNLLTAGVERRHGLEGSRPCQRAHHARDLCARDTEGAARRGRCTGAAYGTEWKQNGNINLGIGLSGLIECS